MPRIPVTHSLGRQTIVGPSLWLVVAASIISPLLAFLQFAPEKSSTSKSGRVPAQLLFVLMARFSSVLTKSWPAFFFQRATIYYAHLDDAFRVC